MNKYFFLLVLSFFSFASFSQIIKINDAADTESSYSPQELIENVLITGTCAQVSNFNSQVSGTPSDLNTKSYGYFKRPNGSSFPFESGIVLSSGSAFQGGGTVYPMSVTTPLGGDSDLNNVFPNVPFTDSTFIEFDFTPFTTSISFNFLMASEEYESDFPCRYSDGFAFFLTDLVTNVKTNIALVPGTSDPVSSKTIRDASFGCGAVNENFYEGSINDTNFNGRTKVMSVSANVVPNRTYRIKLVVADAGQIGGGVDPTYDSAIFLEEGSFNLGADLGQPQLTTDNTAVCGTSKLLDANIVAQSYKWYKDGNLITGATAQTYNANLGDGIYKVEATLSVSCVAEDDVELQFVTAASIANTITDLYACDGDFDGTANFDLTLKDTEILDGQDPTEFEVLYYLDNTYTTLVTDATSLDSTGQIIYVKVQNRTSNNCTAQSSFNIAIVTTEAAKPEDIPKLAACDDTSVGNSFDGLNLFDLEDRKTVILNGSSDTDYTLTYFTDDQYTNQIPTADINSYQNTSQLQTIYVQMTNNNDANCWDRTSFEIEVYKLPVITSPVLFRQCDDDTDGVALMDLTLANSYVSDDSENESFTYFTSQTDAENNNIAQSIPNPQNYISGNNTLWVRVETVHHCYVVGQVDIDVSVTNTTYNKTITLCDDFIDEVHNDYDGISEFDLTQVSNDVLALFPVADRPNLNITFYPSIDDALLQTNLIEHPNKYRNTTNTTLTTPERIYIRIDNKNNLDCAGMGLDLYIDLIVETKPYFEIQDQLLCNNLLPTPLEVRVENYQALYDYTWTDANGNTLQTDPTFSGIAYVTSLGEHTVVATSPNGCEKTHTFNVQLSSLPIIKTLTVFDDLPKNRISVIVTGDGDYEYALDNDAFVDGNELNGHIFYNVDEGLHIIHINDKNGCTPVVDTEVIVIRFPKYISPNHDGKHDVFYVYGGDDFAVSSLIIFDRYGKIIKVLKQNEKWDGTYLGKVALPTDYWFLAKFIDNQGKTYERSGHFSVTF